MSVRDKRTRGRRERRRGGGRTGRGREGDLRLCMILLPMTSDDRPEEARLKRSFSSVYPMLYVKWMTLCALQRSAALEGKILRWKLKQGMAF